MIKVILLDIGGVLVELTGAKRLSQLVEGNLSLDELEKRWASSKYINLYESGQCSTEEFADGFVKEFNMSITPEDFVKEFPSYVKGFFSGATGLLRDLRPNHTLACLSNTNIVQWNSLRERLSIDDYFQHVFLSYEIGKMKPEPDVYAYVIDKLGCRPNEIAFFDDYEANVKAGIAAGMVAYRVVGFEDLRDKLKVLGLLKDGKNGG